jgi:hypothetical protein
MALTTAQIQQAYVEFFNRPADVAGLNYWSQYTGSLGDLYATFALQPEYADAFNGLSSMQQVNAVYQNLLSRDADLAGLEYWALQLDTGAITLANLTLAIIAGAQGSDIVTIANKVTAATAFTNALDTAAEALAYSGADANAEAAAWLSGVTDDASLAAAVAPAALDAAVAVVVVAGGTLPGDIFTLSTGVDNLKITTANTVDTINGVIDGTTQANSTLSVGDVVEGNGKTIMRLAVTDDGTAAFATVKNIDQINVVAGATGTLNINAIDWTGIGSINMVSGVDGLTVNVDSLHTGAGLSVGAGLAGDLNATYANGVEAELQSDRGSSISYIDGVVVGSVDAGGTAGMTLSATANTNVAMTVGDVTIAGAKGASGWFSMWNTGKAGNMTVGDVSVTGNSESWVGIGNWNQTASNPAANVTVGDISVQASDTGWAGWIGVYNDGDSSAKTLGNLTVGNVSLELSGKSATGSITLEMSGGVGTSGNLTAGNIVAKASGVASTIDIWIENNVSSTGANNAKVGDLTLGNVMLDIAKDASITFSIEQYASAAGTGTATAGNFVMGDMDVNVGQAGWFYASIEAPSAWAAGNAATVGNVTVGNRTVTLAGDASMSMDAYWGYASAGGAKAATVGNVVLGDLDVTVGINGDADFDEYIDASGSTASKIGTVTQGTVHFNVDDGGYASYSLSVDSDGTIGDISLGALTLHANVSATAYAYYDFSGDKGIGNVSVGDVTLSGGVSGYVSVSHDFSASSTDASIGNVSFGNLTMTGAKDAAMYYEATVSADKNIGSVTIGNVSMVGGESAYMSASYDFSAWNGSIGDVTVGDITMTGAKDSTMYYYSDVDADINIGNVTIRDVSVVGAEGAYLYASHSFSAWNGAIGAVSIGNIDVSAAKNGTATYEFNMSGETAIGNVTIGNLNIAAVGAGASAEVSIDIENDGVGTIGTITAGDVTMSAKGEFADAYFFLSASSADTIGAMTVGNLDLSVGNDAKKTGAGVDVEIGNWSGDSSSSVTVGNINLTGTTVRAVDDVTMTYTADVSIWSSEGDITVGNIVVAGGDGKADNFATLTNWLSVSSINGDTTLGVINYSGYSAAATLDITGFDTVAGVIGTAKGDTITVAKQTATELTGGAGADTFVINTTYDAKTLATVHKITDFNNAQGDKIMVGIVPVVAEYGEAAYADFAAFLTSAGTADKDVYVGLVGGDAFVAIDHNFDNTVDSVIMLVGLNSLSNIDVASFV